MVVTGGTPLATTKATLQVTPGGNATVVVTIVRSAAVSGPVTLAAEGLSTELTVAPVMIASGATAVAAGGTVAVRLVGTGGTPLAATAATVNVTVEQTLTLAMDTGRTETKAGTTGLIPGRLSSVWAGCRWG